MYVSSYRVEPAPIYRGYFYTKATFLLNGQPVTGVINNYWQVSDGEHYRTVAVNAEADEVSVVVSSTEHPSYHIIFIGTLNGEETEYTVELPVVPHGTEETVLFSLPVPTIWDTFMPVITGALVVSGMMVAIGKMFKSGKKR